METVPAKGEVRGSSPRTVTVVDVMTRGVVSAYPGASVKEVVRALRRNRIGAVPVIDDRRRVVGVVSSSDLLVKITGEVWQQARLGARPTASDEIRRKRGATTAAALMTAPAVTTTATTPITEAAALAARAHVRSLPVIDPAGGELVGIVTRDDFIMTFLRDDTDITNEVVRVVAAACGNPEHAAVNVSVQDGVVILSGRVGAVPDIPRLTAAVTAVAGVVAVRNAIASADPDAAADVPVPAD